MDLTLLVPKSERIIKKLPDADSKHIRYIKRNWKKIQDEVYISMRQANREHIKTQYLSHIEADKCILNA